MRHAQVAEGLVEGVHHRRRPANVDPGLALDMAVERLRRGEPAVPLGHDQMRAQARMCNCRSGDIGGIEACVAIE